MSATSDPTTPIRTTIESPEMWQRIVHVQIDLAHFEQAYAKNLAENVAPGSLRATKLQIYSDQHRDIASSVHHADELLNSMSREPDYTEGLKAFMEKRKADWTG